MSHKTFLFKDLVDLERLQGMFENYAASTGYKIGILSYPGQEMLISTGWKDLGSRFKSFQLVTGDSLNPGKHPYTADNARHRVCIRESPDGYLEGIAPVLVDGTLMASIFMSAPETSARPDGEDPDADESSPADDRSFQSALAFLSEMAAMLGDQGLAELRLRRTSRKLEKSEATFKSLVEHLPQRIFIKDLNSNYVTCNQIYAGDVGLTPEEIPGKTDFDLHPEELARKYRRDDHRVITQDVPLELEEKYSRGDSSLWISTTKVPYRDEAGNIIGVLGIFQDITRSKEQQAELKYKEQLLKNIVDTQSELICRFLPDGTLTYVNPAYCRYFNRDEQDLLGRVFLPMVHDDDLQYVQECFSSLGPDRPEITYQHRIRLPDGQIRWQEWTDRAFIDEQGKVFEYQAVGRDITEHRQAVNSLQESEQRYRGLVESQNDLIVRVDPDNRLTYVNDTYCKVFGRTREELLGSSFTPLVHEEDIEDTLKAMEDLKTPPYRAQMQQRAMTVDGWRWIHWEDSAVLDQQGRIVEIQGVGRDITDLKKAQEDLQQSEKNFRLIFENSPVGMATHEILLDEHGRPVDYIFLDANPAFETHTGLSAQEVTGRRATEVLPGIENSSFIDTYAQVAFSGKTANFQEFSPPLNRHFMISAYQMAHGQFAASFIDITELEKTRRELVRAKEAAEAASQAKSTFLANMSHEIRTPMNAILGFAQILERDSTLGPDHARHVQSISRNADHLLSILNDILDMSRIEAGQIEHNPRDFNLHQTFEDLELMFIPRAVSKGLELTFEKNGSLPRAGHADPGMLRQIMVNLLGNACKFTSQGEVTFRISAEKNSEACGTGQGGFTLNVQVQDSGPGIDPEEMDRIFDPFHQGGRDPGEGGTGLGLPISRKYARIMGGDLSVSPHTEKGSLFCLQVPVQQATRPVEDGKPPSGRVQSLPADMAPVLVMVVDDKKDNRSMLVELLRPLGFETVEAADGREALDLFQERCPQAVLMDIRMPGMDGYQAIKSIRQVAGEQGPFIVAVTAFAFQQDREAALAAGADEYLSKPFQPEDLFRLLGQGLAIEYVMSDTRQDQPQGLYQEKMLPADLDPETISKMCSALEEGDVRLLKELISSIRKKHPQTSDTMMEMAERFDYIQLETMLDQARSGQNRE